MVYFLFQRLGIINLNSYSVWLLYSDMIHIGICTFWYLLYVGICTYLWHKYNTNRIPEYSIKYILVLNIYQLKHHRIISKGYCLIICILKKKRNFIWPQSSIWACMYRILKHNLLCMLVTIVT